MNTQPYVLHALSPLHAGVGQAAELIDLPIARLKGSGIPFVPGSSIKGVLRDASNGLQADLATALFGPSPESNNASAHAGAVVCSDARLLALPVRSFRGIFAYVTSPLLLALTARDLGASPKVPHVGKLKCLCEGDTLVHQRKIYLEDLDLDAEPNSAEFRAWSERLAPVFGETAAERQVFTQRFAIVDDETMAFLWETATQLDQRIRIDPTTRTVAKGQLWLEESLPPESLLIGVLFAEQSRHPTVRLDPIQVMEKLKQEALKAPTVLQFGGKSTIGRGRCRLVMV